MNCFTFARRSAVLLLSLSCIFSSSIAVADDNSGATREAYNAALKCFVANGNARRERLNAGDQDGAARYDVGGKRSFDGAMKLGGMLGLTNRQLNHDLDEVQATELPRMIENRTYFIDAVASCKGLGLMD